MKVEFYTTTAMEIAHYAPIVRALSALGVDAHFVSPQLQPKAMAWGWDDADRIEALLTQLNLPWTKRPDFNADAVVTIQSEDFVDQYIGTRIRMTYGVGLIPPATVTNDSKPFDYHFVHGPFNQRVQFRYHALPSPDLPQDRVKVIGYPKFDEWFRDPQRMFNIAATEYLKNDKPVLLWLPTWGRSSSIPRYADAIFALADKYHIWVRPHHGTVHWERDRMALLAEGPCRVLDFDGPCEPAFAAASIVLADLSSGAFCESLFLRKHVVALSAYSESGRLLVPYVQGHYPICWDPDRIERFMDKQEWLLESGWRDSIRSELVDSSCGADGPRVAEIIMEILNA